MPDSLLELERFLEIVKHKEISFSKISEFEDIFDGHVPPFGYYSAARSVALGTVDYWVAWETERRSGVGLPPYNQFRPGDPTRLKWLEDQATASYVAETRKKIEEHRLLKERAFVSCWHANNVESAAMWNSYNRLGAGVAIVSTVDRLNGALKETNFTKGFVVYDFDEIERNRNRLHHSHPGIEFASDLPDDDKVHMRWLFTKRESFSHEREYRLVYLGEPGETTKRKSFTINLENLLEAVSISPYMGRITADAIKDAIKRAGITYEPSHSQLYSRQMLDRSRYDLAERIWL